MRFESASQILTDWGPDHRREILLARQFFSERFRKHDLLRHTAERGRSEIWSCSRIHYVDQVRLWFGTFVKPRDGGARISSRCRFCPEKSYGITRSRDVERISLFGPLGLANQLAVQEYARERKVRERVRSWLELVRLYWPECTARGTTDASFLDEQNTS